MAARSTSSTVRFRCASIYRCTRRLAAGGRPPRACGAGACKARCASTSERGRVCRARLAVLRPAPELLPGGVSNAGQASSLPAMTSRVGRVVPVRGVVALFPIRSQQQSRRTVFVWRNCDDPLPPEMFTKKSFFDSARRRHCEGAGQCVRPFRPVGIDRGNVQYRDQLPIGSEYGRARTAEIYMSRSVVLAPMNRDRPLFGDAGANAVGSFNRLGPHAAEPGSPVTKAACIGVIAAVLNRDTRIIAEKNRVPCLANHLVQTIEILLGAENQLIKRLATLVDFGGGEDSRGLAAVGGDVV